MATTYSDKLEDERTVFIQTNITEFPESAFLSPDKTLIALIYERDTRKKQDAKIIIAELESGRVKTTIDVSLEEELSAGEWTDNNKFQYQVHHLAGDNTVPRNLIQWNKSSGEIEIIKHTIDPTIPTEYRKRAEKGVRWFEQLKLCIPLLPEQGGAEPFLSQMGWFNGTSIGTVSKDGNTAVTMTSSTFPVKTNDILAIVSKGRLLGTTPYPVNLKNTELKFVGNFLMLQGDQNGKPCVLVRRLPGLQLVGRLNERLVADE